MVRFRFRWGLLFSTFISVAACTNNDINPNTATGTPSKGAADFTKYVAVGNSLTAGFADNGLYRNGQLSSYPNILAGQFRAVGGGDFVQPLFSEAQAAGSGYLKLIRVPNPADPTSLLTSIAQVAPSAVRGGTSGSGAPLLTQFTAPNQNLGVPGIQVADLLTVGYGSMQGNQYFERLLADPRTTYFQYVSDNLSGATFYSCWLGNNDALKYAISGGVITPTPMPLFTTNFTALMNKLAEGGRKGVVVGIPNITAAPYFRTVTVGLVLAQINLLLRPSPAITALVIQTANGVRPTQVGDLLMLPNALEYAKIGALTAGNRTGPYGLSTANPLPTQLVLDTGEVAALNTAVAAFNGVMKAQADAKGATYVDPNTAFSPITSEAGLVQNGITYTSRFIQGGVYSLDGLHLTPAGYALIANELIRSINANYNSTISPVNPGNYRRVLLQP